MRVFVPNRGNEETPYNIYHTMPYPKSKAKAEHIVIKANNTKVRDCLNFQSRKERAETGRVLTSELAPTEAGTVVNSK